MRALVLALILSMPLQASAQYAVDYPIGTTPVTGTARTALADWVGDVWPNVNKAQMQYVDCHRVTISGSVAASCVARTIETLSAADILVAESEGRLIGLPAPEDIAVDGSTATVLVQTTAVNVQGADLQTLRDVCTVAFGVSVSSIRRVLFWRSEGAIYGAVRRRVPVTAVERLQCLRAGTCQRLAE